MFILPKGPISLSAGDIIEGSIKIIRNKTWRRHFQTSLFFKIHYSSGTNEKNTAIKDYQCTYDLWR